MSIYNDAIYLNEDELEHIHDYINLGYRSVCYSVDAHRKGQIIFFGFDKEDNRQTFIIPWKSHVKYNVKYETDEQCIYGKYVETKYFDNVFERKKFVENAGNLNIIECLRPESEFLHYCFDEHVLDSTFNKQKLRIHYLDIETEVSEQFEKPVDARNRINLITIYDDQTQKYYSWSLTNVKPSLGPNCIVYNFDNDESNLLTKFLNWFEKNYPDVISSYNGRAYDIPYLTRRIENVLGKNYASKLSPIGKYRIKEVNHDNARANVQADIEVDINGIFSADELILYRDKFLIFPCLDGGYNLSNVGEHEGLGRKLEYDGTIKDFYLRDFQRFYEYNVRDVELLVKLEEKCKLIPLSRQVTSFGLTNYDAIYSSISYLIGSVLAFAKINMGGKVFTSYLPKRHESIPFEGAFVFPTQQGVYRDGIGIIDFASLYPNTIISINASPETYVGKLFYPFANDGLDLLDESHNDEFILTLPNKNTKNITREQLDKLLDEKCIITKTGTLFMKHEVKEGVITQWCKFFYSQRKTEKKKMMKLIHLLHDKTDISESEKTRIQTEIDNLNSLQLAYKLMINSIYGCMGTAFSPIYNPDLAGSVTGQGRFANTSTAKFIKDYLVENYNAPDDYITIISGDTDSCDGSTLIEIMR